MNKGCVGKRGGANWVYRILHRCTALSIPVLNYVLQIVWSISVLRILFPTDIILIFSS